MSSPGFAYLRKGVVCVCHHIAGAMRISRNDAVNPLGHVGNEASGVCGKLPGDLWPNKRALMHSRRWKVWPQAAGVVRAGRGVGH